jgi:tetratricopeptide (TPR) repeat protein
MPSPWLIAKLGLNVAPGVIIACQAHRQRIQNERLVQKLRSQLRGVEDAGVRSTILRQIDGINSQTPTSTDVVLAGVNAALAGWQSLIEYQQAKINGENAAAAREQMAYFERMRMETEQLRQQLTEYSEDSVAARDRGEALLREDNYIEAAEFYQTAIEELQRRIQEGRTERSSETHALADYQLKLGYTYYAAGMYRKAVEALQEGLKLRELDSKMLSFLGMCYCKLGKYGEAIESLQQSLRQNRQDYIRVYLSFAKGMAAKQAGNIVNAKRFFKQAIQTLAEQVFGAGMHDPELYLIKAQSLMAIATVEDIGTTAQKKIIVKAIRSYTESLKLLAIEARYDIERGAIFKLRAQAYSLLAENSQLISVRLLFSGSNITRHRPMFDGHPSTFFSGAAADEGRREEVEHEAGNEPEVLTDISDAEVEFRPPTPTPQMPRVRYRVCYKREDLVRKAKEDAKAALELNPYSQTALEVLEQLGTTEEKEQATATLSLDDYTLGQRFETGEGVDSSSYLLANLHYEQAIRKYQDAAAVVTREIETAAFRSIVRIVGAYAKAGEDPDERLFAQYSIYTRQSLLSNFSRFSEVPGFRICAPSFYELGCSIEADQDLTLALEYYKLAASCNHADANFLAAKMLDEGRGCDVNKNEAILFAERAAQLNHVEANYWLGLKYQVMPTNVPSRFLMHPVTMLSGVTRNVVHVSAAAALLARISLRGTSLSLIDGMTGGRLSRGVDSASDAVLSSTGGKFIFASGVCEPRDCYFSLVDPTQDLLRKSNVGKSEIFLELLRSREKSAYYFRKAADLGHGEAALEYSRLRRGRDVFMFVVAAEREPRRVFVVRWFAGDTPLTTAQQEAEAIKARILASIDPTDTHYLEMARAAGVSVDEEPEAQPQPSAPRP